MGWSSRVMRRRRRKSRKGEIVCRCRAYRFPHRMMGGSCSGLDFVEEFFSDNSWGECRDCRYWSCSDGIECEVVLGLDVAWECPALADYLDRHEVPVPSSVGRKCWS